MGGGGGFYKVDKNDLRAESILYCVKWVRWFLEIAIIFNDASSLFFRLINSLMNYLKYMRFWCIFSCVLFFRLFE